MFGCCVAGRLLQTNLQQVDETHALFELPAAGTINHVCVFLLGTVPFPDGFGCTVHFYWPGRGFQLLGMLSNDKPSAIFRLRGTFTPASASSNTHSAFSSSSSAMVMQEDPHGQGQAEQITAILGLSVEPLADIAAQLTALHPSAVAVAKPAPDPTLLAERVVKNLFNYISGFTGGAGVGADVAVPMGLIVKWYESFVGKVRNSGVGFLERGDD
ncbi:hypothetical protein C8F04DRAFT_1112531 [Mycena alexandri]|uniref:Hikeshi-like domain-containing protein n=1 Tax=Mycena alexandri TaxID=1745969 RepID=A0AAD6X001_9AGAR|nr:hypothetical protein C8F04DRAFT_1112531 [Mycena alexandri]